MAIRFSCRFFCMSASCFFTQTSLNPSIKIFPINAIEPSVITPNEARIVFRFGDCIILKILWCISSFIQWLRVIPGSRYSFEDSSFPLENFFIIAVKPPSSPITPIVAQHSGRSGFVFLASFSYTLWGKSIFVLEITSVSQVSSNIEALGPSNNGSLT